MLRKGQNRSNAGLEAQYHARPLYSDSRAGPRSRSRYTPAASHHKRSWNRRTALYAAIGFSAFLLCTLYKFEAELALLYFKCRDHSYNRPSKSCRLRKAPLVYARGDNDAVVVWETTCARLGMTLTYGSLETEADVAHLAIPNDPMETHHVHRARLIGLTTDTDVSYSIHDAETNADWAAGTFTWRAGGLSASSFRMAFIADNQYNERVFRRILRSMKRHYRRVPPALLIHAGDAVQNAYDLSMWQTDYSDPLHNAFSFRTRGVPPLLWTPGNHDHDRTGSNPYTGGPPTRRALTIGPMRWLVLDSNDREREQVEWLRTQLDSVTWQNAPIRVILIHISPFIEYWRARTWLAPEPAQLELKSNVWKLPLSEREWGKHVRVNLAPLWHNASHPAHLLLSGHSHAYARGLLAHTVAPALLALNSSYEQDGRSAVQAAMIRHPNASGTIYTIAGGAGGTLDPDRVEDWGFYEANVPRKHHWVDLHVEPDSSLLGSETYLSGDESCENGNMRVDRLTWTARTTGGNVLDTFILASRSCPVHKM